MRCPHKHVQHCAATAQTALLILLQHCKPFTTLSAPRHHVEVLAVGRRAARERRRAAARGGQQRAMASVHPIGCACAHLLQCGRAARNNKGVSGYRAMLHTRQWQHFLTERCCSMPSGVTSNLGLR